MLVAARPAYRGNNNEKYSKKTTTTSNKKERLTTAPLPTPVTVVVICNPGFAISPACWKGPAR